MDRSELVKELTIDRGEAPNNGRLWVIVILAALLLAGAGLWAYNALSQEQVLTVTTTVARSAGGADASASVLDATGYVTARRIATVSAKTTGKVVEVLIEEGMRVEQGQVLARLDQAEVERDLSLSKARLNAAQLDLNETQVRLDLAERELDVQDRAVWGRDDPAYKKMRRALQRELATRLRKLEELPCPRPKDFDVPELRRDLYRFVKGVPVETVLPNGGVAVRYRGDHLDALLRENTHSIGLRTAKLKPAPNGLGMALYLEPEPGKIGVLLHKLPLVRPLDATLDFVIDGSLKPFSSVGVVSGFSKDRRRAHGMSWGLATLDTWPSEDRYNWNSGVGVEGIEPDVVLRMTYEFSPLAQQPHMLTLSGSLLAKGVRRDGESVRVYAEGVQGMSAITVRDVKGWVTNFEVRGIFDPDLAR